MRTYSILLTQLVNGLPVELPLFDKKAENIMAVMHFLVSVMVAQDGYKDIISIDIE